MARLKNFSKVSFDHRTGLWWICKTCLGRLEAEQVACLLSLDLLTGPGLGFSFLMMESSLALTGERSQVLDSLVNRESLKRSDGVGPILGRDRHREEATARPGQLLFCFPGAFETRAHYVEP